MLTIAQITDLHVTTEKDPLNRRRNAERLRDVLAAIHDLRPPPVAIVASGDLVDRGEPEEYVELIAALASVEIPIFLGLGNHDRRQPFLDAFPEWAARADPNGFVQYAIDLGSVRLIMCDTLEEGTEGGGFCEKRAAWLAATLDEAPRQPTIIALHHPPIPSGIQWMDPAPDEAWLGRLADTIRGREQILGLLCGHVHRAFNGVFAGQLVAAGAATSIQLTLDLSPIDMCEADGREILVEEPAGYQLVRVDQGQMTTHVCVAGGFAPAVYYTLPFRKP